MSRRRIVTLSILFCLLASPAAAILSPLGAAAAVDIAADSAVPHFPNAIAFHLDATSHAGEITGVRVTYRPAKYAVSEVATVPVERGTHVTIDYSQNMYLDTTWLPPGVDIEYHWTLLLSDGSRFTTPPKTFFYMDDQHTWKKTSSGDVTLWWYAGDAAFGKDAVDAATRTIDRSKKDYGFAVAPPIRIIIYSDAREFQAVNRPNSPTWIGGFNNPAYGVIVASISPTAQTQQEIRRLIPHEVTHQLTYEAGKNPYNAPPGWLDEGLAVHNQEFPDVFLRPLLKDALDNGKLIPITAMNAPFGLTSNAEEARLTYAEGESIVDFIITNYGNKALGALISAFHGEVTVEQAVRSVLKEGVADLDKEWKASLNYSGDQGGITG